MHDMDVPLKCNEFLASTIKKDILFLMKAIVCKNATFLWIHYKVIYYTVI